MLSLDWSHVTRQDLQPLWRCYSTNHSCDNHEDTYHLPYMSSILIALCMYHPLNPHKALRVASFSILIMKTGKLIHTQWLSYMHPVTRLIGNRSVMWTQKLGLEKFLWHKSKKSPHAACKTSQGRLFRKSPSNLDRAAGREQKPGSLYVQGLKISKNLVTTHWGQPDVI